MQQYGDPHQWDIIHCAATGRHHLKEHIDCQDITFTLAQNDVYAFALADGAGSAAYSRYGAEAAVECACGLLCQEFERLYKESSSQTIKEDILERMRLALENRATEEECSINELASTLLAVAISDNQFLMVHIGDGVIGCVKDGRLIVLSEPQNGEYLNETWFLTSPDALHHLRVKKGIDPDISGFILMSDGSCSSLYDKRYHTLAPVLRRLIFQIQDIGGDALTESIQRSLEQTVVPRTFDDCSLVLAARQGERAKEEFSDD